MMGRNGTASGHETGSDPVAGPVLANGKRPRRRSGVTQLTRTVKALQKAGAPFAAVKMESDGTIIVIPGTPEAVPSSAPNPWDGGDA